MKIAITIIAIFCVSSIEGDAGKRVEFNIPSLRDQLGMGASKNDDLKKCIRKAGFNALDIYDRVDVAFNRLNKRLKGVTDDLSKYEECYHEKLLAETYLKWGQNYISDTCLKTKITELDGDENAKKLANAVFAIDRTLMSLTRELRKRGKGRDKAIQAIACFRYKSTESLTTFTGSQAACFTTAISSNSLDETVDADLLRALDDRDGQIKALKIDPSLTAGITACSSNIAVNALTFEKDEKHFDVACLGGLAGFEDYGDIYNDIHVGFHLAIKKVAKDDVVVARALRTCYDS